MGSGRREAGPAPRRVGLLRLANRQGSGPRAPTQQQTRAPPRGLCRHPRLLCPHRVVWPRASVTFTPKPDWGGGTEAAICPQAQLPGSKKAWPCPSLVQGPPAHTGSTRTSFAHPLTPSPAVTGTQCGLGQVSFPLWAVMSPAWQGVPGPQDLSVKGLWEDWGAGSPGRGQPQLQRHSQWQLRGSPWRVLESCSHPRTAERGSLARPSPPLPFPFSGPR